MPIRECESVQAMNIWLSLAQIGFAVVFHLRPYLALLYPSYATFDDWFYPQVWVHWAAVTSLLLVTTAPRRWWPYLRLAGLFSFSVFMLSASTSFALGIGLNTGSWTYTVLAALGFVQFGRTSAMLLERCTWFQKLMGRPPRWFPQKGH